MKIRRILTLCAIFIVAGTNLDFGETFTGKDYSDGHRGTIFFPQGDISFADEVVSFKKGDPAYQSADPMNALGTPNNRKAAVLGCGGILTLRFVDNALINIKGSDLYVFESGQNVEPTFLSISKDGMEWLPIGEISGGRADIDIAEFVQPGDVFHYVRLRDAAVSGCGGTHPGADINAVGAMGSAIQISMKDSVLFDFGKWELKEEAREELHKAALDIKKYQGARLVIEGHTDSVGSPDFNRELSGKRAGAVKNYFLQTEKFEGYAIETQGYGESRPIASNETDEGRERNRRVDIVLIPEK